uniref:Peroxin-3 n=1 Tax=Kwoniella dejecticola CBS 10117 TaxID=1296121 RepID=A0A1A6AAG4_9TREE|nr:uncharacterized protein I303_03075 [Kwoniella dejecticola CBS 10117]OBR87052.1 hypothetical protein I303_03075 [Kwoniella dejecticola CBS 10117]
MPSRNESAWQRRIRRLFFFVGTASTVCFVSSYILERLKETKLKAIKEKKRKDLMKNHFTSLISTISFTLYALLPTIQPQLFEAYNTEEISQALQGLSSSSIARSETNLSESTTANQDTTTTPHPGYGSIRTGTETEPQKSEHGNRENPQDQVPLQPPETAGSVTESWASEFSRRESGSEPETASEGMLGSSIGQIDTEDAMSSVVSQSISLPPTDTSSPSPPSDLSNLHPSPPRSQHGTDTEAELKDNKYAGKSKKELWKELKIQSLTRTITTIYILPMLYLLTASQLSILARSKYLKDIQDSLRTVSSASPGTVLREEEGSITPKVSSEGGVGSRRQEGRKTGWLPSPFSLSLSSFSIESMGLSEYAESATSMIPNPLSILPSSLTNHLPSIISPARSAQVTGESARQSEEILAMRKAEEEATRAEAEKLFLTYSWWFLNKGWKGIADRVDESVEKIFGNMPLKKELSIEDWELRFKEVRAEIEMELSPDSTIELYDFTSHILPFPSSSASRNSEIPYPRTPSNHSIYLQELFDQSKEQLQSSDGRYLIEKGISTLMGDLLKSMKSDLYMHDNANPTSTSIQTRTDTDTAKGKEKRLVDCLPAINAWGKNIWEGIPDSGIEALLNVPEFEGFSALVFGDWAPRS